MLVNILIIVISLCVITIIIILAKKLPKVMVVDVKSNIIKQAEVKKRLLEERFERHFKDGGRAIIIFITPLTKQLKKIFKLWYQKIVKLEEAYRHKALKMSFKDEVVKQQGIVKMLNEAAIKASNEVFDEAEKIYIEVLTLDDKNIEAYKGLGEIFLLKKDFEHAKETFEFLLKLSQNDPFIYSRLGEIAAEKGDLKMAEEDLLKSLAMDKENSETYLKLAEIYLNLDNPRQAFSMAEQAAIIEPNNPRILDFLIEISIIVQDKTAALRAYQQLKEVNPDNQGLIAIKEKISRL